LLWTTRNLRNQQQLLTKLQVQQQRLLSPTECHHRQLVSPPPTPYLNFPFSKPFSNRKSLERSCSTMSIVPVVGAIWVSCLWRIRPWHVPRQKETVPGAFRCCFLELRR
jgi:hypothetical protein